MPMRLKIAPSILSADFARLADEVRTVEQAGADQIHVDVMDGHFVPNLSMGPLVVRALRPHTALPLDVHLMITDPEKYVEPFVDAGADHVSIHVESNGDLGGILQGLEARGVGRGIVLNPDTPVERVFPWLDFVDLVLVMTVHPGFGGQSFLEDNLEKVRSIRVEERRRSGSEDASAYESSASKLERVLDVQVDGGVDRDTIRACQEAGANVFVAGSSIFGAKDGDSADALRALRRELMVPQPGRP